MLTKFLKSTSGKVLFYYRTMPIQDNAGQLIFSWRAPPYVFCIQQFEQFPGQQLESQNIVLRCVSSVFVLHFGKTNVWRIRSRFSWRFSMTECGSIRIVGSFWSFSSKTEIIRILCLSFARTGSFNYQSRDCGQILRELFLGVGA